jgi:hypothetical protein
MAIPSKQIGWGTEENLLWQISKQLEYLIRVTANIGSSTVVTVLSNTLSFPISYVSMQPKCDGSNVGNYVYTDQTVNDINELVSLYNSTPNAQLLGTYSAAGPTVLALTTTTAIKNALCPTGVLTLSIGSD